MVEALGISLKEFIFYLINFLILMGVLTRFLYKPFLNMLATRKQSIKDALDNAELINRRADEKMEQYSKRISKVEEESREIIRTAKIQADAQARDIIEDARKEAVITELKALVPQDRRGLPRPRRARIPWVLALSLPLPAL